MTIQYKTKGVCSQRIDVTVDNSIIKKVEFVGGCAGNTQGVARLVSRPAGQGADHCFSRRRKTQTGGVNRAFPEGQTVQGTV